ncbi:unnamed protein product [Cunninghamella echinulata]
MPFCDYHKLILVILLYISLKVLAESISPRFLQGCSLLYDQTIYCYGGAQSINIYDPDQFQPTNQFISLNISMNLSLEQAQNNWQIRDLPENYQLEPRAEFAHTTVNDSKKWIIQSGAGPNNYFDPKLKNISIYFNAETNQWSTIHLVNVSNENYNSPARVQLQGASSATFYNGSRSTVITFGGLRMNENNNSTIILGNSTVYSILATSKDKDWTEATVKGFDIPENPIRRGFRCSQIIIKDTIYVIGANLYNGPINKEYNSKDDIEAIGNPGAIISGYTYNTPSGSNGGISNDNATFIPTNRYWHTLTQVPATNDVLLYGGVFGNKVCDDYFYKFHTDSLEWETVKFNEGEGPLGRYGHSAVIKDNIFYILFGANQSHVLQNDVQMLNLTSMKWVSPAEISTTPQLSPGTIAGITIGSIAFASLVIFGVILYVIKRKRLRDYQPPEKPSFLIDDNTAEDEEDEINSYINNNDDNPNNPLYPKPTLASDHPDEINYRELGIKPNDNDETLNQYYTRYPGKPGINDQEEIMLHRLRGIKPNIGENNSDLENNSRQESSSSLSRPIVMQLKKSSDSVKPTL